MARRRVRHWYSRGRKRGRGGFSVNTAFKYIRLGALVAPALREASLYDRWEDKLVGGLGCYGGWNQGAHEFQWSMAMRAWTPYLAATLMTKGISKISGLIKRF